MITIDHSNGAQTPRFFVARDGFQETLMVHIGEDLNGYPIEREATVDEQHDAWVAEMVR